MAESREIGRVHVRVVPNSDGFRARTQKQLSRETAGLEAEVRVTPDLSQFREKAKAATKNLAETEIQVAPDVDKFRRRIQVAAKTTRAEVDLDVDRSMLSRFRERVSRALDGLNNVKGPSFGSGVNGAGFAVIAAGALALLAPLMGILTTAMLTLPGLITAVAAPVAALALGMDGLKKSAERLAQPFADLKTAMSEAVERQFSPVLDKLGGIFPMLQRSLPAVSQGMADLAQSFVDTITSSGGMAKIEATFANIGTAISKAAPGISSFTDGFLTLANKLSEKLPAISDWFNEAGESFKTWINKLSSDGTLDKAFGDLGTTLKTILDALGGLAKTGMEFMQDPKKMDDFNNGLKTVADSLVKIVDLSNQLNNGNLFSSIVPTGLKLDGGIDFGSIWKDISTPFTSEDAGWRDMWESIKSGASSAWEWIKNAGTTAWSAIQSAWSATTGFFSNIWSSITSGVSSAWNSVTSAVSGAWEAIKSAVASGVATVTQYVSELPGKIKAFFADAGSWLISAGKNIVQGLINGIGSMIETAAAKARELAGSVKNAVTGFLGIHSPSRVFTELGQFTGQGFVDGLRSKIDAATQAAKDMSGAVSDEISNADFWGNKASAVADVGVNFARATVDQSMSDLGIGGGAITGASKSLVDWGLRMALQKTSDAAGSQIIYNVGSVQEAIELDRRNRARQALQFER